MKQLYDIRKYETYTTIWRLSDAQIALHIFRFYQTATNKLMSYTIFNDLKTFAFLTISMKLLMNTQVYRTSQGLRCHKQAEPIAKEIIYYTVNLKQQLTYECKQSERNKEKWREIYPIIAIKRDEIYILHRWRVSDVTDVTFAKCWCILAFLRQIELSTWRQLAWYSNFFYALITTLKVWYLLKYS